MARVKSPEKHAAILAAAAEEIAIAGISASTAAIAKRADVAEGTLFTYFPSKEALFNTLYLHLNTAAYAEIFTDFPAAGGLELRTRHIWTASLSWMIDNPTHYRAAAQLKLADIITATTRAAVASGRTEIATALNQLAVRTADRKLASGYLVALMLSMQEATVDFITKHPSQRKHYIDSGFTAFWRAVR